MPNIKSAEKRVKTSERNRQRNVAVKSAIKTAIKKVYENIQNKAEEAQLKESVSKAYSLLDRAVSKGIIHKNTAARRKSRLTGHVNKGTVPA